MLIAFALRRTVAAVPVLLFVGIATFALMYLVPGDAARMILGDGATVDQVERLRTELGLDDPFFVRFFAWLGGLVRGDLGTSVFLADSVQSVIWQRLQVTLVLAIAAEIVAVVLGIVVGVYMALRQATVADRMLSGATAVGIAIPSFVIAIVFVALFAVYLGWLPATGFIAPWDDLAGSLRTLVLPVLALAIHQAALIARVMRGSMIEVLASEYMLAASVRGIPRITRLLVHALPNALGPTISIIGVGFGGLVSGVVVVESVFNIPGLGRLIIQAVSMRDVVLLQGVVIVTAVLYILVNLMTDIAQAWVNPRLKLS